jgi:hypothetical protein
MWVVSIVGHESEAEGVAGERLTHLICERLHPCLVGKCANSSLERCDSDSQISPLAKRPGVPSQDQIAPFPPI